MIDAKVSWQGNMKFSGTADTDFNVTLDSDASVGGNNEGFRPMELLAVSLAGCTAMDVLSLLKKKQQQVLGFEVHVHANQQEEHPHIFTSIKVEYIVSGRNVNPAAVKRSIELSETKYCPVQAMLSKAVEIEHSFKIIEVV